jgi:RHS repeat-associated protein
MLGGGITEQITRTVYDLAYGPIQTTFNGTSGLFQKNLRNHVSYTYVKATDAQAEIWDAANFYSYDIHGNVDTILQDFKTGMGAIGCSTDPNLKANRFKKIVFNYDLISGKVNELAYQANLTDQFYQKYKYDRQDNLIEVRTSRDYIYWEVDSRYEYYRHSLLSRTTLGENRVQGSDYAYTIHGWLRGINSMDFQVGTTGTNFDLGQDGVMVQGNKNRHIGRDAYGFSLYYFDNDYNPIQTSNLNFTRLPLTLPADPGGTVTGGNLYNGNIRAIAVKMTPFSSSKLYGYRYDQLNRIVRMDAFNGTFVNGNSVTLGRINDYHEEVSYDPSGNIRSYLRNGSSEAGFPLAMDSLTYQYEKTSNGVLASNKLRYVHDRVLSSNYLGLDIDSQTPLTLGQTLADNNVSQIGDNYQYDNIGNLTKNVKDSIQNIEWTLYGKIKTVTKTDGKVINYTYDPSGNRISQVVTKGSVSKNTYYVRDVAGNIISLYSMEMNGSTIVKPLSQVELHVYGLSRIGVFNVNQNVQNCSLTPSEISYTRRGDKIYELTNHLDNVLVTINDKKVGVSSNNVTIEYFTSEIITADDYYPFGMAMPGRKYRLADGKYRYGFNGKELDEDINKDTYDYGLRISDQRLGRFFSVDPLTATFPWYTPYQFAGNTPIQAIDLDGGEPRGCHMNSSYGKLKGINVKFVSSQYDNQAWMVKINGGHQRLMDVYAIQDIDKKTYLIFETATGSKSSWYIEYDKNGYKGDVNSFTWYTPPNPANALTAITVGPLVAIPGILVYGKAALIYLGEELLEEAVGFPIIPDPGDIIQDQIKRKLKREALERAAKKDLPTVTIKTTINKSTYWKKHTNFKGKTVHQRDDLIDASKVDDLGRTNLQRMKEGLAPLGPDGKSVNLHHLIQTNNSAVAEVSASLHQKFYKILHINTGQLPSNIDRAAFDKWRKEYWMQRAKDFEPKP